VKLLPQNQWKNPVMFIVYVGSILTTVLWFQALAGKGEAPSGFILAITLWLWFTVLFANFAEAVAEGRSKAQAAALRSAKRDTMAKKLDMPSLFPNAIQTPVNWYQYAFIMGNGFGLGRGDFSPEGKKKAAAKLREVLAENAKLGYGDYRAPPMLQDDVADQYSYNNHVLRRFNETLKDAIDPNGIIMPGRAGVWPTAYRSLRGSLR